MQGNRSVDSFSGAVDLNQGSVSNNTSMDQPTAWNNMLNPAESRSSNYVFASGDGNHNCMNVVGNSGLNFSGWELGETSSGRNAQNQVSCDEFKMEHSWSSSLTARSGPNEGVEERQRGPSNIVLCENLSNRLGGNLIRGGPLNIESSGSDHIAPHVNLTAGYTGNTDDGGRAIGAGVCPSLYKMGRSDMDQIPGASTCSDNVGISSGASGFNDGGSGSSLGSWGLSCKRKALEGTSRQFQEGGSSSYRPPAENISRHTIAPHHIGNGPLSMSSHPVNSSISAQQLNPRFGASMRGAAFDTYPLSGATGLAENSPRNFGMRMPQHSVPLNLQLTGNTIRRSGVCSSHQSSRPISFSDSLDHRPTTSVPTNSSNLLNQSQLVHLSGLPRNMLPFTWGGPLYSRSGNSTNSQSLCGDQNVVLQDDALRSTARNHAEQPMFAPATDTRNLIHDTTAWSLATGNSRTSGSIPSSSRVGPSSGACPFPNIWTSRHNPQVHNQQRMPEFTPWNLFPSAESEARHERGHFSSYSSGLPSSSEDTAMPSAANIHGHHQLYPTSALLMELPSDDVNSWRALAADIEGRQRLVSELRQVLNAMRRGENLRAEDYMLFDPFINGVAELHDRHRDMRLDVDNMSYEELLALEERIGDVNTGLSEETILETMKQYKYLGIAAGSPSNAEPCCICQEEYASGEDVGTLDCGHDFHTNCIKQWLRLKNVCPICKTTAFNNTPPR